MSQFTLEIKLGLCLQKAQSTLSKFNAEPTLAIESLGFFTPFLQERDGKWLSQQLIPSRFMKHFMKEAAERATLKGPYGDIWTVSLRRNKKGGTYLQDGWPEFARYHSLGWHSFSLEGVIFFELDNTSLQILKVADWPMMLKLSVVM